MESDLPPELLGKIFSYLSSRDRLKARQACRRWGEVALMPQFWRKREFVINGQDDQETWRVPGYMKTVGFYLHHLSIMLELSLKERIYLGQANMEQIRKLQFQRMATQVEELLKTENVLSFQCNVLHPFQLDYLEESIYRSEVRPFGLADIVNVTALIRWLKRQKYLSVLGLSNLHLGKKKACQLLKALDTNNTASRMTSLTLRNFIRNRYPSVNEFPIILESIGHFKSLESLGLSYRYVQDSLLTNITEGCPSLKRFMIYVGEVDDYYHTVSQPIMPDWQLTVKKNCPELRVWMNFSNIAEMSPEFELPQFMPLFGLTLDMADYVFENDEISTDFEQAELECVTRCISHLSLKVFILKPATTWISDDGLLVELVQGCASLTLLCLHMTVSQNSILQVAAAAYSHPRRASEEEKNEQSTSQATPATPTFQLHVRRCHTALGKRFQKKLTAANPFCVVSVCKGCEPQLTKPGFI